MFSCAIRSSGGIPAITNAASVDTVLKALQIRNADSLWAFAHTGAAYSMVVWVTLSRLLTCSGPLVFNIIPDNDSQVLYCSRGGHQGTDNFDSSRLHYLPGAYQDNRIELSHCSMALMFMLRFSSALPGCLSVNNEQSHVVREAYDSFLSTSGKRSIPSSWRSTEAGQEPNLSGLHR